MFGTVVRFARDLLQIPDDSQPRHQLQQVVGDVDLPPVKALAGAMRVVMMIIVPALAEANDAEDGVVAALVVALERARAPRRG